MRQKSNVVLTTNDEIAMINRDYRDLFKPTDVLSFPMIDYESREIFSTGRWFDRGFL